QASTSFARRPSSLAPLTKCCRFFGGYFSSSTLSALSRRLIAASWSCASRIWKVCGRPASRWCARSMRLASPWNVPIHMPRVLTGSIADSRVSISRAALFVKVTASTPCGLTWPVEISHAIRVVSTRVLPLPAPARISACCAGSVTAASCCSFRCSRRFDIFDGDAGAAGAGASPRPSALRRLAQSPRPHRLARREAAVPDLHAAVDPARRLVGQVDHRRVRAVADTHDAVALHAELLEQRRDRLRAVHAQLDRRFRLVDRVGVARNDQRAARSGDETLGLLPDDRMVLLGNAGRIAVEIDAGRIRILRRSTRGGRSRAADDLQGGARRARCRGNDGRTKIFLHARSPELHGVCGRRSVVGARRARSDRKGGSAILANQPAPPSWPRRSVGAAAPDRRLPHCCSTLPTRSTT